ncbi:MAG TPA: CDP-alcohol phosphatidyltransferase family protein [Woeseiaceae bacterium]|nr:CDP-alcohol phosphatidyltransferase family protein [Woeseiaceae bacterium]
MNLSWLPNLISVVRILLIPPTLYAIAVGAYPVALALFFFAGFSDGVDGFLAKRFAWQSRLGALLDPAADKLLVAGVFLTLAAVGLVPVWLAAVVIVRDLVIVAGALAYNFLIAPVTGQPTKISKVNTAIELLYVLSVLGHAGFAWPPDITLLVLGAGVLVTAVVSGIDYVLSWARRASERGSEGGSERAREENRA